MSTQKQRGRIWIGVGIFILALLAFWVGRFAFYIHDLNTPPETSLKRYLSSAGDGWVTDDPYYLFPAEEDVLNADDYEYLHKHYTAISFLFDSDVIVKENANEKSHDYCCLRRCRAFGAYCYRM